jgi:hypothetical protein
VPDKRQLRLAALRKRVRAAVRKGRDEPNGRRHGRGDLDRAGRGQAVLLGDGKGAFKALDDQQGLADNWVMDLDFDAEGGLFVATCTKGFSYLKNGKWRTWTAASGLVDDYTLSVKQIGNRVWAGTLGGLSVIEKDRITNLDATDGLSGNDVHDMLSHDGKVYLATDGGLTVMEE